jgi:DHA1 family inner membrane transport protein
MAAGTFLMATTEFVVAGLLPEISGDLDVSVGQAGQLITVFALGMIGGTPSAALLTRRMPARVTLILAMGLFAVGHVVVALNSSSALLLVARFVTAWATGAFWSLGSVVAARAARPVAASRALGLVGAGGMLANVVGVPLGAFAGQLTGWRAVLGARAGRDGAHRPPHTARPAGPADGVPPLGTGCAAVGPALADPRGLRDHLWRRPIGVLLRLATAHRPCRPGLGPSCTDRRRWSRSCDDTI